MIQGVEKATAKAEIEQPKVSASALKVAEHALLAFQTVKLKPLQDIAISASSFEISTKLNDGQTDPDAEATMGPNSDSSTAVNLLSAKANVGVASSRAVSKAYVTNAKLNILGNMTLTNLATTNASAHVKNDHTNVSLVGLGVNVLLAYADGTFEVYAENSHLQVGAYKDDGAVQTAGNLTLTNTYTGKANAISAQPGRGVDVSLASAQYNIAFAQINTEGLTALRLCPSAVVAGDAESHNHR